MEERLPLLRTTVLFRGMADAEILHALECLHARELRFDRDQIIWEPDKQLYWAVVVHGSLLVQQEDLRGNHSILGDFGPGSFLNNGSSYALPGAQPFFFSVCAGTVLLLLERGAAMKPCNSGCRAHLLLLRNAVCAMEQNQARLLQKIEYLGKRSTREKLLAYLAIQSALQGSRKINVPYTRQELADFLAVDRSAMCTELTRMQHDGLLRYERKRFELLEEEEN